MVSWSDVVDYGAAPESFLHEAIKQKKIVFIRIERLFKEGFFKFFYPPVFMKYYRKYIRNKNNPNVYFLCTSAYAARDLARIGIKGDRVLKWAYCPEFKEISEEVFSAKEDKTKLVWCGRLISWKHPEMALKIAEELKTLGCDFSLKIIGDGELKNSLAKTIIKKGLEKQVELCGATPPDMVAKIMQDADIFLATSDKNEGWGVVVNEGMNNGCAVFATKAMGSVPTLIENGANGFYIVPGKEKEVAKKIKELSDNAEVLAHFKKEAYDTLKNKFTPKIYAETFVELATEALNGRVFNREGLGGKADII